MLQCVAACCSALLCVAVRCSVLQCVAVCCSVLHCAAVFCIVLQCVAVNGWKEYDIADLEVHRMFCSDQQHCNTLHHTAPHCNTLHHTATHCNTNVEITGTQAKSFSRAVPKIVNLILLYSKTRFRIFGTTLREGFVGTKLSALFQRFTKPGV